MPRLTIVVPKGYTIIAGKQQLRAVLRKAGAEVAQRARALIRSGGKKRRVSGPGQPPVSRTGTLVKSIKVRPWKSGEGVTVRDTAFYALFLESGATGGGGRKGNRRRRGATIGQRIMPAHPFLTPALEQVTNNGLAERIEEAIVSGLVFQKGK